MIHNAGVYRGQHILPVNIVAPYLLTALIDRPQRLVYLSSGMHYGGRADLAGLDWSGERRPGSYSDSKLFVTTLAVAVARPLAGRVQQRRRPRLGAHQNGRTGMRPTTSGSGTHPRMAGDQRRTRGPHQRRLLVPPAAPYAGPCGRRYALSGRAARRAGPLHSRAADLTSSSDPAPDWSLQFAVGDASRSLIRAAAGADLLVIGARTPDDPAADWHVRAGLFLGQTRCPVVLVPDQVTH